MNATVLLSRLEGVKRHGAGWRADCPVGHTSHGTLAVTEADDGRLLIHCFASCAIVDVLDALGLTVADLFPARTHDTSAIGKRERRGAWQQAGWAAALSVLGREATVITIAAHDLATGWPLSAEDHARLLLADKRIQSVREVLL